MKNFEPEPLTQECESSLRQNALRTVRHLGFLIVYGILAAILITIAVVNYRSSNWFDFMGTRLQAVSVDGRLITMVNPDGELIIMEALGSQSIVHYQGKTFSLMHGPAGSFEMHVTFSDGEIEIMPVVSVVQYPSRLIQTGRTERQQAEVNLLRAVNRLHREFISTDTAIFYVAFAFVLLFVGLFVMAFCLLHFPKKPPSDWNEVYGALIWGKLGMTFGALLIVLAFGRVLIM